VIIFFFFFFKNVIMPMYPTNKSSRVTQNIETYTLRPHVIPHKSCANVPVLEQVKHVNSQLSKVSNKTPNSIIRSCVQNFKLTDEIKSQIFRSTKILRQHEHAFFFFSKTRQSVCNSVCHTPKLKLHIVPNV
jgi:hypothetical protein